MKYYKNTELAELYHVSEKAVRNWIESVASGKLDLELFTINGRQYIANTTKNLQVIEGLVEKRKKFKNSRGHKVISPKPEFYKLFNPKEVAEIISNIDVHNEIPLQYSYFNGGAEVWKQYVQKLIKENVPNTTQSTMQLLNTNKLYLDDITKHYDSVNIIDIGVGDCTPVKGLISDLLEKELLARYMAIDLSTEMLNIAKGNIKKWFNDKVQFEAHKRDINYDLFKDLIVEESYAPNSRQLNIVLFLGGTLSNMRQPDLVLQVINNSMGRDDILLYSLKIDSEMSRRYFHDTYGELGERHKLVLDLLNIEPSMYEVEQFYDDVQRARFKRIKLKLDLTLKFTFGKGEKVLHLPKDKTILVWRAAHKNAVEVIEQFDRNGFDLLHASRTEDKSFLLMISKIKVGQLN